VVFDEAPHGLRRHTDDGRRPNPSSSVRSRNQFVHEPSREISGTTLDAELQAVPTSSSAELAVFARVMDIELRDGAQALDLSKPSGATSSSLGGLGFIRTYIVGTTPSLVNMGNALLSAGLTTRAEASEVSGRGLGTAALRSTLGRLSGRVEVDSIAGQGTTFRCWVPSDASLGMTAAPADGRRRPPLLSGVGPPHRVSLHIHAG
jgi:hypothetical protein